MLTATIFEAEVDIETSLIFCSACIAAALNALAIAAALSLQSA